MTLSSFAVHLPGNVVSKLIFDGAKIPKKSPGFFLSMGIYFIFIYGKSHKNPHGTAWKSVFGGLSNAPGSSFFLQAKEVKFLQQLVAPGAPFTVHWKSESHLGKEKHGSHSNDHGFKANSEEDVKEMPQNAYFFMI